MCYRSFSEIREKVWKTNPEEIYKLSEYYNNHTTFRENVPSIGFLTEERLKHICAYFTDVEDIFKLGMEMNYSLEVIYSVMKNYLPDIPKIALYLIENYILHTHRGDHISVTDLLCKLYNIGKTSCRETLSNEYTKWRDEICRGNAYDDLDEYEKECSLHEIFGWENKKTPERFFDYIGNIQALVHMGREKLVGKNRETLLEMRNKILEKAPIVFAFQFLPCKLYRYSEKDENLSKINPHKQIKMVGRLSQVSIEKNEFEDIVRSSQNFDQYKEFNEAYPGSFYVTKCLTLLNLNIKELMDHSQFKRAFKIYKDDCHQDYLLAKSPQQ